MLLSLYIDNFRSFDQGETFSMIAHKKLNQVNDDKHLVDLPQGDSQALKAAVIYGANGAGKSNLFQALLLLQKLVVSETDTKNTRWTNFALNSEDRAFGQVDIQILSDGKIYQYGLILSNSHIKEEWLTTGTDEDNHVIFERIAKDSDNGANAVITLGKETSDTEQAKSSGKLDALVTLGVKPARTFLSTYQEFVTEGEDDHLDIRAVINWFRHKLTLVGPESQYDGLHTFVNDSSEFQTFMTGYLKGVSTGIDGVITHEEELPIAKLSNFLPPNALSNLENNGVDSVRLNLPNGDEIVYTAGQDTFKYSRLLSIHNVKGSKPVAFPINLESDGTKRLMHLVPSLFPETDPEAVFFIDELDRSLHPNLCYHFVETFLTQSVNTQKQLIITTHESNLLDQDLLRRDEIWFVEKDAEKRSHLYSLVDFQPRKDLDLKKNYLRGRFGAIPFFSTLENPTDEQ